MITFCCLLSDCTPMSKQYYLQYQWMPFYVASLAILVYMPYVLFRIVNTDMVSLRTTMKSEKVLTFTLDVQLDPCI